MTEDKDSFKMTDLKRPDNIDPSLWEILPDIDKLQLIKDCPHPKEIVVMSCMGTVKDKNINHTLVLGSVNWVWEEDKDIGCSRWKSTFAPITNITDESHVPDEYEDDGIIYKVEISKSHTLCEDCKKRT